MNNMHTVVFIKKDDNKYTAKVPTHNTEGDVLLGVGKPSLPQTSVKADLKNGVLELNGYTGTPLVVTDLKLHYC